MSMETVIQITGLVLGGFVSIVVFFLTRGVWALVAKVIELNTSVAVFAADLKSLKVYTDQVPELAKDVHGLHQKVRRLSE
jgi:hypothetical protein